MVNLLLLVAVSALIGVTAGLLAVRWWVGRLGPKTSAPEPTDPFVSAEIDQAAAAWATAHGRPEAAGIMADKLHLLYEIGQRRRRS
jgi:predicted exporter